MHYVILPTTHSNCSVRSSLSELLALFMHAYKCSKHNNYCIVQTTHNIIQYYCIVMIEVYLLCNDVYRSVLCFACISFAYRPLDLFMLAFINYCNRKHIVQ